jgi:predicted glycosyltransferase
MVRVLQAWQQRRRDLLLDLLRSVRPAAVLVELFPFGRRKFHFELEPLLDACFEQDPRPAVLCSVRDVLVVPYDGVSAQQWAADKTLTYFDAVLVCCLSCRFLLRLPHSTAQTWVVIHRCTEIRTSSRLT